MFFCFYHKLSFVLIDLSTFRTLHIPNFYHRSILICLSNLLFLRIASLTDCLCMPRTKLPSSWLLKQMNSIARRIENCRISIRSLRIFKQIIRLLEQSDIHFHKREAPSFVKIWLLHSFHIFIFGSIVAKLYYIKDVMCKWYKE